MRKEITNVIIPVSEPEDIDKLDDFLESIAINQSLAAIIVNKGISGDDYCRLDKVVHMYKRTKLLSLRNKTSDAEAFLSALRVYSSRDNFVLESIDKLTNNWLIPECEVLRFDRDTRRAADRIYNSKLFSKLTRDDLCILLILQYEDNINKIANYEFKASDEIIPVLVYLTVTDREFCNKMTELNYYTAIGINKENYDTMLAKEVTYVK